MLAIATLKKPNRRWSQKEIFVCHARGWTVSFIRAMTAVVLNAVAGPIVGQTWSFDQHDTFIFGRAPDCHAQLDPSDSTASRHHFILEVQPPLVTIRDLGSRNGTYVNGENIASRSVRLGPQVLQDGDEVKVGHTRFVIRVSGSVKRKTRALG